MAHIRPEVLAFKQAAEKLLSSNTDALPLSNHEMEQIADCLTRVEEVLEGGEV